jgi:hypothetical protein
VTAAATKPAPPVDQPEPQAARGHQGEHGEPQAVVAEGAHQGPGGEQEDRERDRHAVAHLGRPGGANEDAVEQERPD